MNRTMVEDAELRLYSGIVLTKRELLSLAETDINDLTQAANRVRAHFCGESVDFCAIVNAKSGRCSENCRYCAQSRFYQVKIDEYPLLSSERIVEEALLHDRNGVGRFSIVTSGRKITPGELIELCRIVETLKEKTSLSICASLGILSSKELQMLKNAGLTRYHHNLETSRRFFASICSTHSYDDRLNTIAAAREAGLEICSGGIIGLGETMEDRIDMAMELRDLEVGSIPINVLNPIAGTPLEHNAVLCRDEVRKTVALYRFILPSAQLRLAGGRVLFDDKGKLFFLAGANAAITGSMLTTSGISIDEDRKMITELGLKVQHEQRHRNE
ncbi:MAG: biotin synthase BioB [Planctomycetia bacterium]|nr:biotin synthase BioB [Planctomycetia bacterium]